MSNQYKVKKFVLDQKGVREAILKAPGTTAECGKYASQVYGRCSGVDGYTIEQRNYPERTGYAIYAQSYPAIADNLKNNTLLKALK